MRWCLAALVAALAGSAAPANSGVIVFAANRASLSYGEIYRVDLDGRRVDLSRSAAYDVAPALSPSGSLVAFMSNRGGRAAIYTVRIDGTHLTRISPFFFSSDDAEGVSGVIAWSPNGTRLVASMGGYGSAEILWFGDRTGQGRAVRGTTARALEWSPDGREVAYQPNTSEVDVVTPAGVRLWTVPADYGQPFGWSSQSARLAVERNKRILLYDERGRKVAAFPGTYASWSPNGLDLASVLGRRLEIRPGGIGNATVDAQLPPASEDASYGTIDWLGDARLRVANGDGFTGFDVAADRVIQLPAPFAAFEYPDALSSNGSEVANIASGVGLTATLTVDSYSGTASGVLATGPPCAEQPWFDPMQFTPDGGSLVYQTGCQLANADIYSIRADGTDLRQLTDTSVNELEPSVSPDGTKIAYVQNDAANKCDGCPWTISVMNADGTGQHALTAAGNDNSGWFDEYPAWTPDGGTITFQHATFDSGEFLWSVPAAGGKPTLLVRRGNDPAYGPTRLAYMRGDIAPTLVQTSRFDGTDVETVARDGGALIGSLAWSRQGTLAYLRSDAHGRLQLVVVDHGTYRLGRLEASSVGGGLAWSPDGKRLVFGATDDEGLSDLWLVDSDGTKLTRLTRGVGAYGGVSWG